MLKIIWIQENCFRKLKYALLVSKYIEFLNTWQEEYNSSIQRSLEVKLSTRTVMLPVMTYFLSSKIDPNSLRETYFEVLYFEVYNDIKLEEANTKTI